MIDYIMMGIVLNEAFHDRARAQWQVEKVL